MDRGKLSRSCSSVHTRTVPYVNIPIAICSAKKCWSRATFQIWILQHAFGPSGHKQYLLRFWSQSKHKRYSKLFQWVKVCHFPSYKIGFYWVELSYKGAFATCSAVLFYVKVSVCGSRYQSRIKKQNRFLFVVLASAANVSNASKVSGMSVSAVVVFVYASSLCSPGRMIITFYRSSILYSRRSAGSRSYQACHTPITVNGGRDYSGYVPNI